MERGQFKGTLPLKYQGCCGQGCKDRLDNRGASTWEKPWVPNSAPWFEISVSEKFQPLQKSLKFSFRFGQMTGFFGWNSFQYLKILKDFECFFEFLCSTEIAEIICLKGNYFGLRWNHWNSVNFNAISLNFKTMGSISGSGEAVPSGSSS